MMVTPDPVRDSSSPVIGRIGMTDVRRLADSTRACRILDYRHGGGSCQPTVLALLRSGQRMLTGTMSDRVFDQLCVTIADLHNLAGWTSFDTGRSTTAMTHFERALELARAGRNQDLLANIRYRMGRVRLHHDQPEAALTQFRLGLRSASKANCGLTKAILAVNEGWAHAKLGHANETLGQLARASDELGAADRTTVAPWSMFFDQTDLAGTVGVVHTELARTVHLGHAGLAIPALTTALAGYGPDMARSQSFCLIALATNHLLRGEVDEGTSVGMRAIDLAATLSSGRTKDRMGPLSLAAQPHQADAEVRELINRIDTFVVLPAN